MMNTEGMRRSEGSQRHISPGPMPPSDLPLAFAVGMPETLEKKTHARPLRAALGRIERRHRLPLLCRRLAMKKIVITIDDGGGGGGDRADGRPKMQSPATLMLHGYKHT